MLAKRLMIGAVVLLIIVLWWVKRRTDAADNAAESPARVAASRGASPSPAGKPKLPKNLQAGAIATAKAEDQVGLQRAGYLTLRSGKRLIELRLEARASCHTGDLDLIKTALGGRDWPLLVSLEPLSSFSWQGSSRPLRYANLQSGTVVQLSVQSKGAQLFGLFICSDRRKQRGCRGKRPLDMHAVQPKAGTAAADDQIFYFQPLVIDEQKFLHFGGSGGQMLVLAPYLTARGNSQDSAVETSRKLSDVLGSFPISSTPRRDHNGHTLHLALPYLDMAMCAAGKVRVE